jgi:transporter family protein
MNSFGWAVTTAFIWGCAPLLEKMGLTKVEPMTGLFYRCLGVVIGLVFLTAFWVKPAQMRSADLRTIALLVASGLLGSFLGQIPYYIALKDAEMSRVVLIAGSYPVIAVILGVLALHESVTLTKVAGTVCVIAGLWLLRL